MPLLHQTQITLGWGQVNRLMGESFIRNAQWEKVRSDKFVLKALIAGAISSHIFNLKIPE